MSKSKVDKFKPIEQLPEKHKMLGTEMVLYHQCMGSFVGYYCDREQCWMLKTEYASERVNPTHYWLTKLPIAGALMK